jgi:DNA polymerase-3 subunit delta
MIEKKAVDVLKEIRNGEVHKLYLLTGKNGDYLKDQILNQTKEHQITKGLEGFDFIVISGTNATTNEIINLLQSPPYGNGKVIVIHQFFKIKKQELKKILKIKIPEGNTVIIFTENEIKQEFGEKDTVLVRDYSVTTTMLRKWIKDKAKLFGKKIEKDAINEIINRLDNDLFLISSEIKKLALYTNEEKTITLDDVKAVVPYLPEVKIFSLIDLIVNNKKASALKTFNEFLQIANAAPEQILSLLLRSFMHLAIIKELLLNGTSVKEIPQKSGIYPAFTIKKLLPIARTMTYKEIIRKFHELESIDVKSKKGEINVPLALKLFIENS